MDRVRVGVVGVGGWGKHHLRVYSELSGMCSLEAVCDSDRQKAAFYGEKFEAEAFTDLNSLLEARCVDALSICTPPETHHRLALRAIDAGVHVLVEKPLTTDAETSVEVYLAAKKAGVRLAVGLIERFNRGLRTVKEIVTNGELGPVRFLAASRIAPYSPSPSLRQIGVILDAAVHDIDAVRFLLEEEPAEVYAKTAHAIRAHPPGRETEAEILLSFKSGRSAYLVAEWIPQTPPSLTRKIRQLQVTGSAGTAILSYIPQLVWKIEAVDILTPFVNERGEPNYSRNPRDATLIEPMVWEEPLREELRDFLRSVSRGEEPAVTGLDAIRAAEVAEAAIASAEAGTTQRVKFRRIKP